MAEKAVQTVKNLLKKAIHDKQDPYIALLDYRNTPVSDTLGSPAQRLMGRCTKTLIPTMEKLLQPKTINPRSVQILRTECLSKIQGFYNMGDIKKSTADFR